MKKRIFALICLFSVMSFAKTKVAFLEVYDSQGRLVEYEPGSRFGHSALQVGPHWLESYPGQGVQLISWQELEKRGKIVELVEIPVEITWRDVQSYVGKPFDFSYSWSDDEFYCSELIAKILGIPPEPMQFNRKVWPPSYWPLEGQPGISPDKIHRILRGPGPYY